MLKTLMEEDYANIEKHGFKVDLAFQPLVLLNEVDDKEKPVMCEVLARFMSGEHKIAPDRIIHVLSHQKKVMHYFELAIFLKAVEELSSFLEQNEGLAEEARKNNFPLITINMLPSTLVYYNKKQNVKKVFPPNKLIEGEREHCSLCVDEDSLGCALSKWIAMNHPNVSPSMIAIEIVEAEQEYGMPDDEEKEYLNNFELHSSAIELMNSGFYVLIDDFSSHKSNAFRMTVPSNGVKIDGRVLLMASKLMEKNDVTKHFMMCYAGTILETAMMYIYSCQQRCSIVQNAQSKNNKGIIVIEHIENEKHMDFIRKIFNRFWEENKSDEVRKNIVVLGQGFLFNKPTDNLALAMKECVLP